jgi:hypothetical protein
LKNL